MNIFKYSLLALLVLTFGFFGVGQPLFVPGEGGLTLGPVANLCDMKTIEKAPYCESCNTVLKGYNCDNCKRGLCEKCKPQGGCGGCEKPCPEKGSGSEDKPAYKKPGYVFTEEETAGGKKCPCCQKEKLSPVDLVDAKDKSKCLLCGEKTVKNMDFCARKTYYCPAHPETTALKARPCQEDVTDSKGKTQRCLKVFVEKSISRSKITEVYRCPKCNADFQNSSDKCCAPLQKKKKCEKSGEFPHIKGDVDIDKAGGGPGWSMPKEGSEDKD